MRKINDMNLSEVYDIDELVLLESQYRESENIQEIKLMAVHKILTVIKSLVIDGILPKERAISIFDLKVEQEFFIYDREKTIKLARKELEKWLENN